MRLKISLEVVDRIDGELPIGAEFWVDMTVTREQITGMSSTEFANRYLSGAILAITRKAFPPVLVADGFFTE